jgi:16S rRNA (guanine527-N7)-methyltransferase
MSPSGISSLRRRRTEALSVSRENDLTAAQQNQISVVLSALADDEHAPTAVRDRERAAEVHVADSLVALELDVIGAAQSLADLGSGAGFPGLALAIALPEATVSLIESQRRRCEFLERVIGLAGVENARVVCTRAEEWQEGLAANDVVTARALAPQAVVLEYAAPLLRIGGALVDWRGARVGEDEAQAERAAARLGLRRLEIRAVTPFAGAANLHLHVFVKDDQTPSGFPRRAGMARKRPLVSEPGSS